MLLARGGACPAAAVVAAIRGSCAELVTRLVSLPWPRFDAGAAQELFKAAARGGFLGILRLLLRHERVAVTRPAAAVLLLAARHDRCECAVELLAADVNAAGPDRKTPLHTAIQWGARGVVSIFCGHRDIDVNARNGVSLCFRKEFFSPPPRTPRTRSRPQRARDRRNAARNP
jgi:hypothetical protein